MSQHFRIGIGIGLGVIVGALGGYWGGTYQVQQVHDNLQAQLATQQAATDNRLTSLEDALLRLDTNASALADLNTQTRDELRAFQDTQESTVANITSQIDAQTSALETIQKSDITRVVAEWAPFVYSLQCNFLLNNELKGESKGSATLEFKNGSTRFVTNKHVLTEEGRTLDTCVLSHPNYSQKVTIPSSAITLDAEKDIGYGIVPASSGLVGMSSAKRCAQEPAIGDAVVILGYPAIGSKESVTATDGIISGIDNGLYLTSAKIEKGNSGGIAVHVKNDCFLGLPTLAVRGSVESLARILPLSY